MASTAIERLEQDIGKICHRCIRTQQLSHRLLLEHRNKSSLMVDCGPGSAVLCLVLRSEVVRRK